MSKWVVGYKMQDEFAYDGHLYRDLRTAKLALVGMFTELIHTTCDHQSVKTYRDCRSATDELTGIFEEDFHIDTPLRRINITGVDFLLGNEDLMKERNIHEFDQRIKIKTDHSECTEEACKHREDKDEDDSKWSTNI